jgi:hypothetical protein
MEFAAALERAAVVFTDQETAGDAEDASAVGAADRARGDRSARAAMLPRAIG